MEIQISGSEARLIRDALEHYEVTVAQDAMLILAKLAMEIIEKIDSVANEK